MLEIYLTSKDRKRIHEILKTYQSHKKVQSMQKFVQHGRTSTYEHCMNVVHLSYWLNKRFHLHADEKALLVRKVPGTAGMDFPIPSGRREMPGRFLKSVRKKSTLSKAICGR